jgi:hypothetical protein
VVGQEWELCVYLLHSFRGFDVVSGRLRAGSLVFEHGENGRFNVIFIKYVLALYQILLVRLISSFFHGCNVVYILPSV